MAWKLAGRNDVCVSILSAQSGLHAPAVFTAFPSSELRSIQKQLEADSIANVLLAHDFAFPFERDRLLGILEEKGERPDFLGLYVLNSFLSWYILLSKQQGTDCIELVLKAMVCAIADENSNSIKGIATSAFVNTAKEILDRQDEKLIEQLVQPLGDFLLKVEKIPNEVFDLVAKVTQQMLSFAPELSDLMSTLVELVIKAVNKKRQAFPVKFIESMLHTLSNAIVHLDPHALQFCHATAQILPESNIVVFFEPMLTQVMLMCDQSVIPDFEPIDNDLACIEPEIILQYDGFSLPLDETMMEGIRVVDLPQERLSFEKCMSEKVYIKMTFLSGMLLNHPVLLQYFVAATEKVGLGETSLVKERLAVLFYLYKCAMDFNILKKPPPSTVLYHKSLWNPNETAFRHGGSFKYLDAFRQLTAEACAVQSGHFIETRLLEMALHPLLYAEMVLRLKAIPEALLNNDSRVEAVTNGLMIPLLTYRNYPDRREVKEARSAVFDFLHVAFSYEALMRRLMSQRKFAQNYVLLILEPPIRSQILGVISDYLRKVVDPDDEHEPVILECLAELVTMRCASPNDDCESLLLDLLKVLNECVMVRHSLSALMRSITSSLCKNAMKIDTIVKSKDVLMQLTSFLALTASDYTIKAAELCTIEEAIINMINDSSKNEIMIRIVQIIAGGPISVFVPNFEISQPKILGSFIRIFSKTDYILEALDFVGKLCAYSVDNCVQCHVGGLDQLLVDQVNAFRVSDEGDDEVVDAYLRLFVQIATTVSSVTIVRRFVALLCPVKSKYLSRCHRNVLNAFSDILIASRKVPNSVLPLSPRNRVELCGVEGKQLENGFSFCFWVFLTAAPTDTCQDIFTMVDKNDSYSRFILRFQGGVIHVQLDYHEDSYNGDIKLNLPVKVWSLITVVFYQGNEAKMATVDVFVDNTNKKTVRQFLPFRVKGGVASYVNATESDHHHTSNSSCDILMGPFILCRALGRDEVASLYDMGPRPWISSVMQPIFALEPSSVGDHFTLQSISASSDIKPIFDDIETNRGHSFFDLFLNFCKPSMILPVFAQVDMPYRDGTFPSKLCEFAVDIIRNLLILGERGQRSFSECNGFHIISHLLQSCGKKDSCHVTFSLYSKFFGLMGIITYDPLRKELFELVITNVELWRMAKPLDHLRILRHWIRTVYPEARALCEGSIPLQWVLFMLHEYYGYVDSEDKEQNVQISDYRQALFEIALTVTKFKLSSSDVWCVVGYLLEDNKDWRAKVDLLRFMNTVFSQNTSTQNPETAKAVVGSLPFLRELLRSEYDVVILTTIECICAIHGSCAGTSMKLSQHVYLMMRVVQYHCFSDEGFGQLIELLNRDLPELLPLVSMVAVNKGEESVLTVIRSASRGQSYLFDEQTMVFPVMMLFTVSEENRIPVAEFLVSIFSRNWQWMYNTICVIGQTKPRRETEDIQHLVLLMMSRKPRYGSDVARWLLRMIRQFVFFRKIGTSNEALQSSWKKSMFCPEHCLTVASSVSVIDPFEGIEIAESTHIKSLPSSKGRRRRKRMVISNMPDISTLENVIVHSMSPQQIAESYLAEGRISSMNLCEESSEPNSKNIGPDSLSKEIENAEKSYVSYQFGLRMGVGCCWLDADLAKQSFAIFKRHKLEMYCELIFLLAFFLRRVKPEELEKEERMLTSLKPLIHKDFQVFWEPEPKSTMPFFEKMTFDIDFINQLMVFSQLIRGDSSIDISLSQEKRSKMLEQVSRVVDARKASTEEWITWNARQWSHLWKAVTISRAPWHDSLPSKQKRYKRDNRFGMFCCPLRLRPDLHSGDHLTASLLRDTGSREVTELKVTEIRSRSEREAPASLLFSIDLDDAEKKPTDYQPKANVRLDCMIKTVSEEIPAKLEIQKNAIVISAKKHARKIRAVDILYMLYRTRCHRWQGFEVFTKHNTSILLFFEGNMFRTVPTVMRMMPLIDPRALQLQMFPYFVKDQGITDAWCRGLMSNFEYLMKLNLFSGRSFNDAEQYPYFPWVISDYKSETLDLENPGSYRDLSKPLGAIDQERLAEVLEKAQDLKEMGQTPFLFSSGPTNGLTVCLYLLRLEPFTTQHIDIQGGKFDHATRVFRSLETTYRMVTTVLNDYRELIPEFFFLPEMLANVNHLDLGQTSDGTVVGDVILPPWAKNPFDFIYKNRKALESDYVSKNLHKWIDLVWGYKQRGAEAWKANNVYQREAYEDVWFDPAYKNDPDRRNTAEHLQRMTGQIPAQLFQKPHPQRQVLSRQSPCFISNRLEMTVLDSGKLIACHSVQCDDKGISWRLVDDRGFAMVVFSEFSQIKKAASTGRRMTIGTTAKAKPLLGSQVDHFHAEKSIRIFNPSEDSRVEVQILDESRACYFFGDSSTVKVVRLDNGVMEYSETFPIDIESLASSGDGWFIVACKDAEITVYHNRKKKRSISSFRESIRCTAIAPEQDTLICGTKDQSLLVCSLNRCSVLREIDIAGRPRTLLVTKSMGIIAVEVTQLTAGQIVYVLMLYDINGLKINEKILGNRVAAMTSFVDGSGFDKIVLADAGGDVYVFEAYPLELGRPIIHVDSKVIGCSHHDSIVTVVCQDGKISMVSI